MNRRTTSLGAVIGLTTAILAGPAFAEPPALVTAYAQSLVHQCGGAMTPALASQVIQAVDLNGDKTADWLVDASRYPCPNRPAAFADQGSLMMLFAGRPDGQALPALQKSVFATHIETRAGAGPALWLTLGGRDCGAEDSKARCDRRVVWLATARRFDIAAAASGPPKPAAATATARK